MFDWILNVKLVVKIENNQYLPVPEKISFPRTNNED